MYILYLFYGQLCYTVTDLAFAMHIRVFYVQLHSLYLYFCIFRCMNIFIFLYLYRSAIVIGNQRLLDLTWI